MLKKAIEAFQSGLDAICHERWFRLYGNGLCILALGVAKYGAGFTWRQVLVGLLVVGIWNSGLGLLNHDEKKRRFQRVQFRIGLTHFGQALIDAGIYSEEEIKQVSSALWDSLGKYSSGYITFTWLQQDLFFMNTSSIFSSVAELSIGLIPFGSRKTSWGSPDSIELRDRGDAYELVLIKSENRSHWIHCEGPSVRLMELPHAFFRSLQEPPTWNILKTMENEKRQNEILESAGLTRWQDSEVSSNWAYKGQYAELHWWTF